MRTLHDHIGASNHETPRQDLTARTVSVDPTIDAREPFDVIATGAHPMIWRSSLAERWRP
jgi:hypothetical protein